MKLYHKLILLTFLSFFISCKSSFSDAQKKLLIGHWQGKAEKNGKSWHISYDILKDGNELKFIGHSLDYGRVNQVFEIDDFNGTKLTLKAGTEKQAIYNHITFSNKKIIGQFDGLGFKADFFLEKKSDIPIQFEEELHAVHANGITLKTKFIKPISKSPYTTVIFMHGSGNQTMTNSHLNWLAYEFARAGIGSILFDRRGKGGSTGESYRLLDFEIQADDAVAIVDYYKGRQEIRQLGIYGLSQGGWTAPLAVSKSQKLEFLITASASGINAFWQSIYVEEMRVKSGKLSSEEKTGLLAYINSAKEDGARKTMEKWHIVKNAEEPERIMRFFEYDIIPTWQKTTIPTLAIWGADDRIVPSKKSFEIISKNIQKNPSNKMLILENANHAFWVKKSETNWDFPRRNKKYIKTMISWIKEGEKK